MFRKIFFFLSVLVFSQGYALEKLDFAKAMGFSPLKNAYMKAFVRSEYTIYKTLRSNYYKMITLNLAPVIPKQIHFFADDLPEQKLYINQCSQINFDYALKRWSDDEIRQKLRQYNISEDDHARNIFKSIILFEQGGIFLDNDIQCLKSFNDILGFDFFAGVSQINNQLIISPSVMAAKKSLSLLKNLFTSKSFEQDLSNEILAQIRSSKSNILILPSVYFYPTYPKTFTGEYIAEIDPMQSITIRYDKVFSTIKKSPFDLEMAGGNYFIRYIYNILYSNDKTYKAIQALYDKDFPSLVKFELKERIPLVFHVICINQNECDEFMGNNMHLIGVNKNHAFQLWQNILLEPYIAKWKDLLARADNEIVRRKILMLLVIYDKGGVFISDKLLPNLNLYELCNKYDLFLGVEKIRGINSSIYISSELIGTKQHSPIIEATINKLKNLSVVDDQSIDIALTESVMEEKEHSGRIIIFPGRYFFSSENGLVNFTKKVGEN